MRTAIASMAVLLFLASSTPAPYAQTSSSTPVALQPAPTLEGHALIDQYCMGCHSDRLKSGGLALSALNLDAPAENAQSAEIAEKVIRKLRGGLMPPASTAKRPDAHATAEFVSWLENRIDTGVAESKPGRVP